MIRKCIEFHRCTFSTYVCIPSSSTSAVAIQSLREIKREKKGKKRENKPFVLMSRKTYFSRMIGMKSSANKAVDECFQHMFASPEIAWVSNICFKIKKTDFLVKHGTERQCLGIYIITNNMRACVCI